MTPRSLLYSLVISLFVFGLSGASAEAATKYWYSTSSTDWSNASNWWDDAGHSAQSSTVPGASDDAILLGSVAPLMDLDVQDFEGPASIDASITGLTVTSAGNFFSSATEGNVTFENSAFNSATINGDATFNGTAWNHSGTIQGNAVFNDGSMNITIVEGDAVFNQTANNSGGSIGRTATFNNNSTNNATVVGNAVFNGDATNQGASAIVEGDAIFNDFSVNGTPAHVEGLATFNDDSLNDGTVADAIFNGNSQNRSGGTVTNDATFNDDSDSEGAVGGTATFPHPEYTFDPVGQNVTTAYFSDSDVTFNISDGEFDSDASEWMFAGTHQWIFTDASNEGTIAGTTTFDGTSYNYGEVIGNAIFNGSSSNEDTVTGNAYFYDEARANGTITGDATFYGEDSEPNTDTTNFGGAKIRIFTEDGSTDRNYAASGPWTLIADGAQVNYGAATIDETTTLQEINGGSFFTLTFYWYSTSDADWNNINNWWTDAGHTSQASSIPGVGDDVITVAGSVTPEIDLATWDNARTIDATATGLIVGVLPEDNNGYGISADVTGDVTFYEDAANFAEITGNAVFRDSTVNRGAISGNAEFHEGAQNVNEGSVGGDATFYGNESENLGTVSGDKIRHYEEAATVTRDFVSDGPWTIVADGVVVNIIAAQIDGDTVLSAINGGSFYNPDGETKYWHSTSSTDWHSTSNWWTDVNHTVQASSMPTIRDTVILLGSVIPEVDLSEWNEPVSIDSTETGGISFYVEHNISVSINIEGNASFSGQANNSGTISGDAEYYDFAYNDGTVQGNAEFHDEAANGNSVEGDAVFYGNESGSYGTVNGSKTRYYEGTAVSDLDFVSDGPWTVISDGGIVYIGEATYDESTVFEELNGGTFSTDPDEVLPIISGISVSGGVNEVNVSWQTDEDTDAQVEYGLTSEYGLETDVTDNDPLKEDHIVHLEELDACTEYHFRVISSDVFENTASSTDQTFTTDGCQSEPNGGGGGRRSSGVRSRQNQRAQAVVPQQATLPSSESSSGGSGNSSEVASSTASTAGGNSGRSNPGGGRRFDRFMNVGSVGEDVQALQQYLNQSGFTVAPSGAGSPGNETTYFGGLTQSALSRFQGSIGLPATGYFGPMTQGVLNSGQ